MMSIIGTDFKIISPQKEKIKLCLNSFALPTNTSDAHSPHDVILDIIRYYVLLGFLSIFFYWVAWTTWIISAERQVRRIRLVLFFFERERERRQIDFVLSRYRLFRNILRQEIGWFDVHNAGELSNRLIEDLDKIKDGIKYFSSMFLFCYLFFSF